MSLALQPGVARALETLPWIVLQNLPLGSPLGRLLVAIAVLAVVVLVGRVVLAIAWRLIVIAGVVVAVLYLISLVTV